MAYFLRKKILASQSCAVSWTVTVFDALAILEDATLECKQRDIYTPELKEALDCLQPLIWPEWLIPQFRYHSRLSEKNEIDLDKEAQQQALRAILLRIRASVTDSRGKQRCGYTY